MENFMEYMWYLLTTPFKRVRKSANKWYALCKVLGKRFDEAKEDILRARDEGMVATCCHEMLPVHGADRRLVRYDGEHPEKFRERIAKYERICILGGTNEGVLLAVQTLGFKNPEIKTVTELYGDTDRWAEFYVILPVDIDLEYPISIPLLKKGVRTTKEVGAKDNYLFSFSIDVLNSEFLKLSAIALYFDMQWGNATFLDGQWKLDGEKLLDSILVNNPLRIIHRSEVFNAESIEGNLITKYHWWLLDGTYGLNGIRRLDAELKEEWI